MRVFIGVAWPYANSYLHLGHIAGAYLPASIFAKYQRLIGNDVLMVSGSDEHGTPIMVTAEREGKTPEEVARFYHRENSMVMEALDIGFDIFTETSTENHKRVVQDFIKKLIENGYTYEASMEEPYCTIENRFLPDRYVEGKCPYCGYMSARGDQCDNCGKLLDPKDLINPKCRICGSTPEIRESRHLFFRLSALENRLTDYIESLKRELKPNVYNFTINFLRSGLKDRAITRDMSWGIEVPVEGYESKRVYVWFEAVIGYLSAAMEWSENDEWESYWKDQKAKHYYFVGKDNIPFHTIIWPGMLIAHGGLKLPDNVPANEYLLLGGEKFSKSRGISINVRDLLKLYDPDMIRYYLASNMPEDRDSEFRFDDFISKNNNELVANLGNFVHRVLTFSHSNFGSVPEGTLDPRVRGEIEKAFDDVRRSLDVFHFKEGMKRIMALSSFGNLYFYEKEPWKRIKEDREDCANTIYSAAQIVNALSVLMAPYLPFTSRKIRRMLGLKETARFDFSEEKTFALSKPEILFRKIEETFSLDGIELVVGRIEDIKDHPQADKLYVMSVDIGTEKRQIIAGLKGYLSTDDLLGKDVVVVSNLKHAKLRGLESQGMLLAAEKDGKVVPIHPESERAAGTRVGAGYFPQKKSVDIDELKSKALRIEQGRVLSSAGPLMTEDGVAIIAEIEDGAEVR